MDHLVDGDLDEGGRVERDRIGHARRQGGGKLSETGAYRIGGAHGVGAGGELDGGAGGSHAVLAVGKGVGLRPQLDPGHVTQHQLGAIGTCPQYDGGECLGSGQLPLYREGNRQSLARQGGFVAEAPRCNLHVLLLDGLRHLADGQPVGGELARIYPDAHGLLGAEQLHSPHAVDAAQLLHDIARHVVVQRDLIEAAIR